MKITKLGHCCLLIEIDHFRILTDPGNLSTAQDTLQDIDIILITHEHQDHLHTDSVKAIMENNPGASIVTNSSVGKKLDELGIKYTVLEGTDSKEFEGKVIEAHDGKHEEIFEEYGQVQNTGYLIDNRLFCPGDSFHDPQKPVEILALPVAGPWCKIADALHYAIKLAPKKAFPVHDGLYTDEMARAMHRFPINILPQHGIEFIPLGMGDNKEF
jgi:L-ascorbate metabolism protein UlaG (beta-lactamase superfamily)